MKEKWKVCKKMRKNMVRRRKTPRKMKNKKSKLKR